MITKRDHNELRIFGSLLRTFGRAMVKNLLPFDIHLWTCSPLSWKDGVSVCGVCDKSTREGDGVHLSKVTKACSGRSMSEDSLGYCMHVVLSINIQALNSMVFVR